MKYILVKWITQEIFCSPNIRDETRGDLFLVLGILNTGDKTALSDPLL